MPGIVNQAAHAVDPAGQSPCDDAGAMSAAPTNPLIDDRDVELILDEVLDLGRLLRLPYFADHDRETCELLLASARELARDQLYPAYRALDAEPPRLVDG